MSLRDSIAKIEREQYMAKVAGLQEAWGTERPELLDEVVEVFHMIKEAGADETNDLPAMSDSDALSLATQVTVDAYNEAQAQAEAADTAEEVEDADEAYEVEEEVKEASYELTEEDLYAVGLALGEMGVSSEYIEKVASEGDDSDLQDLHDLVIEVYDALASQSE